MRIAVMGSGAVGGYFGARLARGGADVAFIARGPHLAAIREHGLTITGPDRFHLAKVTVTDDPATIGIADLVIFAVKLSDTETASPRSEPMWVREIVVIHSRTACSRTTLRAAFGAERIMGGRVLRRDFDRASRRHQRTGPLERLVFGGFDGTSSPRADRLLEACRRGGTRPS